MLNHKLYVRQVCLFLIAFTPIIKLFSLPSILAQVADEDMWLCALLAILLDLTTICCVLYFCTKTKGDFFFQLQNSTNKLLNKAILFVFFIYLSLKAIMPIIEQKDYVENTLYTLMPTPLYFLPFFGACFFILLKPLKVLGRLADVFWVSTLLGLIILIFLSLTNVDFSAILPIGARGPKVIFSGMLKTLSWFGDGVYLLFFSGSFKCDKKSSLKIIGAFLISSFAVLAFMIVFYGIFTSIAFRQRFAFTEISKYTTVISNLGRFDYIGILLLLLSNVISLSIPLYFSSRVLERLFNVKIKWLCPLIIVLIYTIITLFTVRYAHGLENFIVNDLAYFYLLTGNVLPIILSFTLKGARKNER